MNAHSYFATLSRIFASLILGIATISDAKEEKGVRDRTDMEAATRLQVFLDRAEFAPGKIDGRYGEFTLKALALYREAQTGKKAPVAKEEAQKGGVPDVSDLNFADIEPLFLTYTVTETDLKSIGNLPTSVPEQAKKKLLPYKDAAEALAEKFHTDVDFLEELNPGKTKSIKAGDTLSVPNVQPFELTEVKELKPGGDMEAVGANDIDDEVDEKKDGKQSGDEKEQKTAGPEMSVKINAESNMLTVYQDEKLIAAYPVTIGSDQTKSPVGDWKVRGVAKMPNFRYDKAMLNKGERSDDFHMLPPGPNNPVGVIWIALNKKGIGLHGTSDPDQVGRSASHGCVRLANWDIVRLAGKIKATVPVSIQ